MSDDEKFVRRFQREAISASSLNHPNIVKVYDVSFGDLIQYIVMEYVDGITLKQYINQQTDMRWKDAVYLTIQVLRALQHAHDVPSKQSDSFHPSMLRQYPKRSYCFAFHSQKVFYRYL